MSTAFKRVTDQSVEAKGFVLYADENWMEVKVDFCDGASLEGLHQILSSRGVVEGLDDGRINELIESFNSGGEVHQETIATGTTAMPGKDGYLEFLIEMEPNKVEVTDADGNVDFRDLNLIKEIHSGNPVAKVMPPQEGKDGVNTQGKVSNVNKGRKAIYRMGKNIRLDEDSQTLYATADGHVEVVDSLVSVQEEFVVNKDVDFTIGNLTFIGSLSFAKGIPPGYTMRAGKNIIIKEKCEKSTLIAKGDITCEAGITGSANTNIKCEGNLRSRYINEAVVTCMGDVECFYEAVRSNIKCMGKFILESGHVRGCEVEAFDGVRVNKLGSPMGTPTTITVGLDFSVESKVAKLQEAISQLDEQKGKLKEAIEPFMKNKLLLVKAPESKKSAVKSILNKIDGIDAKIKKVEEMISQVEAKRFNRAKQVEINGEIEDDVTIVIGNKKKKFNKGKRKGYILYDKQSFEIVFSRGA